jgi:filamentous hemagglutinin family protein
LGIELMFLNQISTSCVCSLFYLYLSSPAIAQIIPDQTTRINSSDSRNFTINGGDRAGSNLFHSFQEFSVPTNGSAIFNNPSDIKNIFTRITGSNPSSIDGLIQTNGSTNLFLLNPNGIIFGANARLDIGGSFFGSTANSIRFADGTQFSAIEPASSLLTVSAPIGLQYGANPGAIQVQGSGNNLRLGVDFETLRSDRPTGLQVNSGQTLALIGGDILFSGGNITAPNGHIELGSVRSAGTVALSNNTFNYQGISTFGDIRLAQAASAEASSGGSIQVQAQRLTLSEGSALISNVTNSLSGGGLTIRATDSVNLRGIASISAKPTFTSTLTSEVDLGATGQGGNISITTGRLHVTDGGLISAAVFGAGQGGNIQVAAQAVDLVGGAFKVALIDDSLVDIPGSISTDVNIVTATGSGGDINLVSDRLHIADGANISASTTGAGNAGNLNVTAQSVDLLSGNATLGSSGLFNSVTDESASGNGGRLTLNIGHLRIFDGARVSSGTSGLGNGGNIRVNATTIDLVGASSANPSGILSVARSTATGNGGNVQIQATRLNVADGAQVSALTTGAGNAGNLRINAQSVELTGVGELGRSGLFASAIIGKGAGGNLRVTADRLTVQDGATINVSNFPSLNLDVPPGQGTVGSIVIRSPLLRLQGSQITTNSQSSQPGGNIAIATDFLLASNNSDITANAVNSLGGQISITAQGVFGTQVRPSLTPASDITASSDLGTEFNGLIILNTPNIDPSQGLIELPKNPLSTREQITNACENTGENTFVVSGRGGVSENPSQVLRSQRTWQDLRVLEQGNRPQALSTLSSPIIEAQNWAIDENGRVSLVATLGQAESRSLPCQAHMAR